MADGSGSPGPPVNAARLLAVLEGGSGVSSTTAPCTSDREVP